MPKKGVTIGPLTDDAFREFARKFATSPEIGPIRTALDSDSQERGEAGYVLVGLSGCGRLCSAACLLLYPSKIDGGETHVVKLDSVIVDPALRRRGLGGVLVAQAFRDLVAETGFGIRRIYAHSVHPATVSLLKRLGFIDPPPVGAPISNTAIEPGKEEEFLARCDDQIRGRLEQLRLQCEFCRKGDRRARPWCLEPSD